MNPGKPLYDLSGVLRRHQGRVILSLDRLTLDAGGITAIKGPNGAGKSTLLQLLAFLRQPDQGRVLYRGLEAAGGRLLELRRRVTLVAQDAYLFNTTVEKNVAYGLWLRGESRSRRMALARRALTRVGLDGFGPRRVRQLSGGECQRVALARALVLEPEVLILDEPFSSLDVDSVGLVEDLVRGLPGDGCAVILVTHAKGQAERLASRVLIMEMGHLVEDLRLG